MEMLGLNQHYLQFLGQLLFNIPMNPLQYMNRCFLNHQLPIMTISIQPLTRTLLYLIMSKIFSFIKLPESSINFGLHIYFLHNIIIRCIIRKFFYCFYNIIFYTHKFHPNHSSSLINYYIFNPAKRQPFYLSSPYLSLNKVFNKDSLSLCVATL